MMITPANSLREFAAQPQLINSRSDLNSIDFAERNAAESQIINRRSAISAVHVNFTFRPSENTSVDVQNATR